MQFLYKHSLRHDQMLSELHFLTTGEVNYGLELQHHTGQTTLLLALTRQQKYLLTICFVNDIDKVEYSFQL